MRAFAAPLSSPPPTPARDARVQLRHSKGRGESVPEKIAGAAHHLRTPTTMTADRRGEKLFRNALASTPAEIYPTTHALSDASNAVDVDALADFAGLERASLDLGGLEPSARARVDEQRCRDPAWIGDYGRASGR